MAHLKVNTNLSAQDLRQQDLVSIIEQILTETGLQGSHLTLEITESMLIEDIEATIALLQKLQARQVQISIDDFGTGYSSLSYLHRLPVNSFKVDRSFVAQMQQGTKNHPIVETIATLSHQLGLNAIAEGIENLQQFQQLRKLGYSFGQGHWFASPLTADQVTTRLANQQILLIDDLTPLSD